MDRISSMTVSDEVNNIGRAVVDDANVTSPRPASRTSNLDKTRKLNEFKKEFVGARDLDSTHEAFTFISQCFKDSHESGANNLHFLAIGVLLQIISSAPPKHIPAEAMSSVYTSLARPSITYKNDPVVILAHMRLLHVSLAKCPKMLDKRILQDLVIRLKDCVCYGVTSQSAVEHRHPRDRLVVSTSMNTFMLPVAPTTSRARKAIRKRGSNSSLSSARSDTSDSEASGAASRAVDEATIRFEGLKCLASLAQIDSRGLHPYWPMFFDISGPSLFTILQGDPALSVRDMAVKACCCMLDRSKGYLALAKEASSKSAFTSLSETLAGIASRLNQLTVEQLERRDFASLSTDSKEHWLKLADAVLANTPYHQLHKTSLAPLIKVLLSLCYTKDTTSVSSAVPVLARAIQISASSDDLRKITSEVVLKGLQDALAKVKSADSPQRSWALLVALASRLPHEGLLSTTCDMITSSFSGADPEIRLKQIEILHNASAQPISASHADLIKAVQTIMQQIDSTSSDLVLTTELARLICLNAKSLPWADDDLRAKTTWLFEFLVSDANKANRAIAYNCIGAVLQGDAVPLQFSKDLLGTLTRQADMDPAQGGKADALWHLANVCDSSKVLETHVQCLHPIYELAISAAGITGGSRDIETIRTSAIRILGTALGSDALADVERRTAGIQVLLLMLTDPSAKIQWNTATALRGVLATAPLQESRIIEGVLKALLQSKNVKVCSSLIAALEIASHLADHKGIDDTLQQVKLRLATLDNLPFEEFTRAEQTQIAVHLQFLFLICIDAVQLAYKALSVFCQLQKLIDRVS